MAKMAFRVLSNTLVLISVLICSAIGDECPFNKEDCKCYVVYGDGSVKVGECQSTQSAFPQFKKPSSGKGWVVDDVLTISPSVDKIPAFAFDTFGQIADLQLIQSNSGPTEIKWSPDAFDGKDGSHPRIDQLSVSGLSGVFEYPGLERLVSHGLTGLGVKNGKENLNLKSGFFKNLTKLSALGIGETPIVHMDEDVFKDLADTLDMLELNQCNLRAYPKSQLAPLKNMHTLDLSYNGMKEYTESCFKDLNNLASLDLSGNDINAAIKAGAFKDSPKNLSELSLENGGLTSVPKEIIPTSGQDVKLHLANNSITSLKKGDFKQASQISYLDLSHNPITSIETGAVELKTGDNRLRLSNTKLASFDFSVLSGTDHIHDLDLDDNTDLKSLTVSNKQLSTTFYTISLQNSGLVTIDESVEQILKSQKIIFFLLRGNKGIKCDDKIHWIAKYAFCDPPYRADVDGSTCSDGTPLEKYLKNAVRRPCDK